MPDTNEKLSRSSAPGAAIGCSDGLVFFCGTEYAAPLPLPSWLFNASLSQLRLLSFEAPSFAAMMPFLYLLLL